MTHWQIEIFEENAAVLPEYEKISIAFAVKTMFSVELVENGLGGVRLIEETLEKPFLKDYDEHETERPSRWAERFDISNWGFFTAFDGEKRVGAAAIALKTPEIFKLDGREDSACLWDLRIAPEYRGKGIGKRLFAHAVNWSKEKGCRLLMVETQNVNVPACRFYARQGCKLGAVNRFAYPEFMNEIQLVWYRNL